jgi:putative membrane protein
MNDKKLERYADGVNVVRGMLMGGADVIPGVSGGTVALVLGIYTRLVTAISHVDIQLITLLRHKRWRDAANHVDLRFVSTLLLGIALGIFVLGQLMRWLLTTDGVREITLAGFLGTILASSYLVARMIRMRKRSDLFVVVPLGVGGVLFAFWLTGFSLPPAQITLPYVFFGGLVAICAMILPGISGAYILLIMGLYLHLTDILHSIRLGQLTASDVTTVAVFGAGCVIGIVSFSKVLRWFLAEHEPQTMAVLCGFMIGALRRVWPFQQDITPHIPDFSKKEFHNVMPESLDANVWACLAVAAAAYVLVLVLNRITHGSEQSPMDDLP